MSHPDEDHERGEAARLATLAALCRLLAEQRSAVLTTALEVLPGVVEATGALAYRVEGAELVLVADTGLSRKAKPWLARLPLGDDTWFVAQRVAKSGASEIASEIGGVRDGHSLQVHLAASDWTVVAAIPIGSGRTVHAVLVLAARDLGAFGTSTRVMLDAAAAALAVALEREEDLAQRRDLMLSEARTTELATVGWLASAAAADLDAPLGRLELELAEQRNVLGALQSSLDSLIDAAPTAGRDLARVIQATQELTDLAWDLRSGVRQARAVTAQLLSYSESTRLEAIDLGEFVEATTTLLREGFATRGIDLVLEREGRPLRIIGRRDGVTVLIVQLLQQAARSCSPGGPKRAIVRVKTSAETTGYVLTVEWSGRDTAAERPQAFNAFLGLQDPAAQSEIGLTLARRTVLAHNGHIELGASDLGGGLIRVVFPGRGAAQPRERDHAHRPDAITLPVGSDGRFTIVWVDSDETTARALARMLPSHVVRTASNAQDARRTLESLAEPPRLVLCDLGLADDGAIALHREASDEVASSFVFTTGGVVSREAAHYVVGSGRPTLIKPIALDEIVSLLALSNAEQSQCPSSAPTLTAEASHPPDDDDPVRGGG